jgi:hypothetical protein
MIRAEGDGVASMLQLPHGIGQDDLPLDELEDYAPGSGTMRMCGFGSFQPSG